MSVTDSRARWLTGAMTGMVLVLVLAPTVLARDADDRARQVYEIFRGKCFECHGEPKKGGLDLRTQSALLAGGLSGRVVVPHAPAESRLFLLVSHDDEPRMPYKQRKLSDLELAAIRQWIQDGASLEPVEEAASGKPVASSPDLARLEERPITPDERRYWAFQPPRPVPPPAVPNSDWSANPIDAFLIAPMTSRGLRPSLPADPRALIRRAYLDVTGLPPTPAEVDAFVRDGAPDAWERVVVRLLASPHYGERWARHWLDLARYADSGGFEFDVDRAEMWRYRDYVVDAFNRDKPYDQFIREQIAGDEYTPASDEAVIATGFLRLGPEGGGGGERGRQDSLDDIVSTTSLTFLGLTVGCARCHNHKFDPIPQKDYYRIQAVFASTRGVEHPLVPAHEVRAYEAEIERVEALLAPLRAEKRTLEAPYLKRLVDQEIARLPEYLQKAWQTPPDRRTEGQRLNVAQIEKTLQDDSLRKKITDADLVPLMSARDRDAHRAVVDRIAAVEGQKPAKYPTARAIREEGRTPRPSYYLHRGSPDAKGSLMTPGVLTVAIEREPSFPAPPDGAASSWRRRGFAEWVASPSNPLTARVIVNRLWQHHFGEGIVRTPSNFGKLGEPPSHPELLDWLAIELVARGWSLKAMHRLMLTSRAYRMASDDIAANVRIDPENQFLWRMPRQRLEAEIIRDQVLAAAGTLDRTLGGPNVFPYIDPDLFEESSKRTWRGRPDDDPSTWRRSLYVFSKRSIRYPLFETFDQPNLVNSVDRRNRSTVAPQALLQMNTRFVILQAERFAARLRREAGPTAAAQVERAFRLALGRPPDAVERKQSIAYVKSDPAALAEFCHVLFNLNEFVYRP